MNQRDAVTRLIDQAIAAMNAQLPAPRRLPDTPALAFVGEGCGVESLTLMGLIVDIEERVMDAFGTELALADLLGLPLDSNPFRSRAALEDAIAGMVGGR